MITEDKVIEIFCVMDDFVENLHTELQKDLRIEAPKPELMPRVFFHMMPFMKLRAFGKCSGISFVDSTMIPVCHNLGRHFNKVSKDIAADGKGTMGWCHGFRHHLPCNDCGEIMTFCLTGANVDDRDAGVWNAFARELHGKVFADRGTSGGHSSRNSPTGAYTSCTG